MRSLRLLALVLLAIAARADTFDITFYATSTFTLTGDPFPQQLYTGSIVKDGICKICSIHTSFSTVEPHGIESLQLGLFDVGDNAGSWSDFTFDVATLALDGSFSV